MNNVMRNGSLASGSATLFYDTPGMTADVMIYWRLDFWNGSWNAEQK